MSYIYVAFKKTFSEISMYENLKWIMLHSLTKFTYRWKPFEMINLLKIVSVVDVFEYRSYVFERNHPKKEALSNLYSAPRNK